MNRDELIRNLNDAEATDLAVLRNAYEVNKRRVVEDPSDANMRSLDRAGKMLDQFFANRNSEGGGDGLTSMTKAEAFKWLSSRYKIGKSKFYKDCSAGTVEVLPDKTIPPASLRQYATTLKPLDVPPEKEADDFPVDEWQQRKLIASTLREEQRQQREARELEILEGKHIPREDHYLEMAGVVTAIESLVKQRFQDDAARLIEAVRGDLEREHELKKLLDSILDEELTQLATSGSLEVIFSDA